MERQGATRTLPRNFLYCGLAIIAATFAASIWVASKEWFWGDDFIFLTQAQQSRDWWQVFFPLEPRLWWSYRPLTIDVFFAAGFALVGMRALPFFLVILLVHFATAALLYRIALQLGFERRIAFFTGCLLVLMYPTLHEIFWVSAFQPVAAIFFYLLAVTVFLRYLERGNPGWLFASLGAQVLTLMSNELGVTLPGVLGILSLAYGSGGTRSRLAATVRRVWPHALVMVAYMVCRFIVFAPPKMSAPAFYYKPRIGFHIFRNLGSYVGFLAHEEWFYGAVVAALLLLGWAAVLGDSKTRARRSLLVRTAVTVGWMLAAAVPFAGMWFAQQRMAMVQEAPFCLLLGAHLDAVWSKWGVWRPRAMEWSMVALLIAAVPYATLWERAHEPRGAIGRQILHLMHTHYPNPKPGTCVALRAKPGTEWKLRDLFAVKFSTSGLLAAAYPNQGLQLRVPTRRTLHEPPAPKCIVFDVLSRSKVEFGRPPVPLRRRAQPPTRDSSHPSP